MSFRNDAIFWVEVHKIFPNPYQPRREFDEARLKDLAESIRQYGVLQPLVVTRKEVQKDDGGLVVEYELIAGERRLRASRLAGIEQVPVIIRDGAESDRMKLELAIIENLQREDLNAIDRAHAFKQLTEQFGMSHSAVAQKMGKSREYVSNTLRLLLLTEELQLAIQHGKLTEGHARALMMLNDRQEEQKVLFREIMLKKLSVREVERITRKIAADKVRKKDWGGLNLELIEIEKRLTEALGTRVQIAKTDFGGKVVIDYFSPEDLDKIIALMIEEKERNGLKAPTTTPVPPSIEEAISMVTSPVDVVEDAVEAVVQPSQDEAVVSEDLPEDDRSKLEKQEEDDTDLYAVRNFSL